MFFPEPDSRVFRFLLFPIVLIYFLICVLFGGWPFNLVLQDWLFNSSLALILLAICILHTRNAFQNITRDFLVEAAVFVGIIAVAAYLRFKGVHERAFSGPTIDEPLLVRPVLRMLQTGTYDFQRYEYGGVYFYILQFVFVLTAFRLVSNFKYREVSQIPEVEYYTAGRIATVFFSVATVAFTYIVARKYFGKIPAIAAALVLTFSLLSFLTAHQIRLDVVLALWVLLAHWFFLRMLQEPSSLNYAFAGTLCGLAVGTKYTVVPIFLSLLITHALSKKERWMNWNLVLGLFCGAGVYFITNFYAFVHLNQFLVRLPTALYHMNPNHWSGVPNRALEYTFELIGQGIGFAAFVFALLTLPRIISRPDTAAASKPGLAASRPGPADAGIGSRASDRLLILWTFPLLHLLTIGSYPAGYPRYLLPILPLLAILAGEGLRMMLEWAKIQSRIAPRWSKALVPAALALLIVQPAWGAFRHYSEVAKILPPKEVIAWIEKNIPEGSQILSDPTGPTIPQDRYNVSYLSYVQFMDPKNVKNYEYVCVTEDLFNRIPHTYDVLHEFPARTKSLDRAVRVYKARK